MTLIPSKLSSNRSTSCQETKLFFFSSFDCVWTKGMLLPGFKLIMLFFVMMNLFSSAALWVGWPSILGIYKNEGVYSNLCFDQINNGTTNSTGLQTNGTAFNTTNIIITCDAQSNRFNVIYTAASSCYLLGKLFFGFSLDILGPKITNVTSNFLAFLGSTLLIFYQHFDSLLPGWILLSLGGSGMISCALHFANLFPSTKSFVLGVIPTALLISGFLLTIFQYLVKAGIPLGFLLTIFQYLVKAGIPLYVLFICYSTVQFLFMIFDIIWQPMKNFEVTDLPNRRKTKVIESVELEVVKSEKFEEIPQSEPEIDSKLQQLFDAQIEKTQQLEKDEKVATELKYEQHSEDSKEKDPKESLDKNLDEISEEMQKKDTTEKKEKKKSQILKKFIEVIKQTMTLDYFLGCYYLLTQSIMYSWYTGTLFEQFSLMGDLDHSFSTAFNFALLTCIFFVPFHGLILKYLGIAISYFISITLVILLLAIQSIPFLYIQPIGFLIFAFARSFLVSVILMHFNETFGFGNIGILYGNLAFLVGILSFIQIPFKLLVTAVGDRYWVVNLLLIGFGILSYALPVYLSIKAVIKRTKKQKQKSLEEVKPEKATTS
eukprot:gene9748-2075_t